MKCTICNNAVARHRHHIVSKSMGGENRRSNYVELCPNCHDSTHRGEIIIEGWCMTTSGRVLLWRKAGEETITGRTPKVYIIPSKR